MLDGVNFIQQKYVIWSQNVIKNIYLRRRFQKWAIQVKRIYFPENPQEILDF